MVSACSVCRKIYVKGGPVTMHLFPRDEAKRKLWESNISKFKKKDFKATNFTRICSRHFTLDSFDRSYMRVWLNRDAVPTLFEFPYNGQELEEERELTSLRKDVIERNDAIHQFMMQDNNSSRLSSIDNLKENKVNSPIIINVYSEKYLKSQNESKLKVEDDVEFETEETMNEDQGLSTGSEMNLKQARSYRYLGDFVEEDMYSPTKARIYFQLSTKYRKQKAAQLKLLRLSNSYLRKRLDLLKHRLKNMRKKNLSTQEGSNARQLISPMSTKSPVIIDSSLEKTASPILLRTLQKKTKSSVMTDIPQENTKNPLVTDTPQENTESSMLTDTPQEESESPMVTNTPQEKMESLMINNTPLDKNISLNFIPPQ